MALLRLIFNKAFPLIFLSAGTSAAAPVERRRQLMGALCHITAYGPGAAAAATAAFDEIARWEKVLSVHRADSEVAALNQTQAGEEFAASPELGRAVAASLAVARRSRGFFDPTVLPALREGPAALARVGWRHVGFEPSTRRVRFLKAGMGLDFGGIGKGIALDAAARVLRERGAASSRLNFGGQILALGAPPGRHGWEVRIPGHGLLEVSGASVSTSGDSERGGHIVDPRTGRAVTGRPPVTVVSMSAGEADAWSTALYAGADPALFGGCVLIGGDRPTRTPACRPFGEPGAGR